MYTTQPSNHVFLIDILGIKFLSPTFTVSEGIGEAAIEYVNHALWNETYQLRTSLTRHTTVCLIFSGSYFTIYE